VELSLVILDAQENMAAPVFPRPYSYVTRGHDLRLQKSRAKYDLRKLFLSCDSTGIMGSLGHLRQQFYPKLRYVTV